MIRKDVSVCGWGFEPSGLRDAGRRPSVRLEEGTGVGWGTMPATIHSSWNTAVISTRNGGAFGDVGLFERGRWRMRATLMKLAQAMRRVESSCQWRVHLNRSALGLSAGLSMKAIRVCDD